MFSSTCSVFYCVGHRMTQHFGQRLGVQSAASNSLTPGQCFHGDMRGAVSIGFSLMSLKGRTMQRTDLIWGSNLAPRVKVCQVSITYQPAVFTAARLSLLGPPPPPTWHQTFLILLALTGIICNVLISSLGNFPMCTVDLSLSVEKIIYSFVLIMGENSCFHIVNC